MIGIIIVLWIIALYTVYLGAMVNYLEEELQKLKEEAKR